MNALFLRVALSVPGLRGRRIVEYVSSCCLEFLRTAPTFRELAVFSEKDYEE